MRNVGAGETYNGYLVKKSDITNVESFIKTTSSVSVTTCEALTPFRYRYIDANERLAMALPAWAREQASNVIFTSDADITPSVNDRVYFEDGTFLLVVEVMPQRQLGAYMFSKKFPYVIRLK